MPAPRPMPHSPRRPYLVLYALSAITLFLAPALFAQVDGGGGGNSVDSTAGVVIAPPDSPPPAAIGSRSARPSEPLTTNALIGYVNSEPVFALDIFRPIDDELRRLASISTNSTNFRKAAAPVIRDQIQAYMNESLIVTAAQATLTDSDKQLLDTNLNKETSALLSKYDGSVAAADKALAATGSNMQKEKTEFRRQLIVRIYMSKNLMPKVVVTRQMVIDAYEKDPTKWEEKASVELYTITLPVTKWLREPSTTGEQGPIIEHPTAAQIKGAEADAMAHAHEIVDRSSRTTRRPTSPASSKIISRWIRPKIVAAALPASSGARWSIRVWRTISFRFRPIPLAIPCCCTKRILLIPWSSS